MVESCVGGGAAPAPIVTKEPMVNLARRLRQPLISELLRKTANPELAAISSNEDMRGDVDVALVVTPGDGVMSGYQVCLGEDQSCKKYFSFCEPDLRAKYFLPKRVIFRTLNEYNIRQQL